jgi:hypothetical protein
MPYMLLDQCLEMQFPFQSFEDLFHTGLEIPVGFQLVAKEPLFDSFETPNADLIELQNSDNVLESSAEANVGKNTFFLIIKRKIPDSSGNVIMGYLMGITNSVNWSMEERDYFKKRILGKHWDLMEQQFPDALKNQVVSIGAIASRPNMEKLKRANGEFLGIGSLLLDVVERKRLPGSILYLESKIESVLFYDKKGFQLLNPEMKVPRCLDSIDICQPRNNAQSTEEVSIQQYMNENRGKEIMRQYVTELHIPMYHKSIL